MDKYAASLFSHLMCIATSSNFPEREKKKINVISQQSITEQTKDKKERKWKHNSHYTFKQTVKWLVIDAEHMPTSWHILPGTATLGVWGQLRKKNP